jgi:dolichyl-phosphate-mannose-protein mannosyltransferase
MKGGGLTRSCALRLAGLTLVGLLLRVVCLVAHPPTPDDIGVTLTAINYLESGQLGPTMWNHPGLRNFLAYGMLQLFGPGMFGVVGLNLLLGTLCIPLLHALALRLTGSGRAAFSAALLFTLEPLAIQYSSQAINDIYLVFFPLAGILAAYRYLDTERPAWLLACGALFGLGLASKWSALFQLAVVAGLLLRRLLSSREPGSGRLVRGMFLCCTLVVVPGTIYLVSFAPWFARGYSLAEWPALQKSMYRETKLHTGYKDRIYGDHRAELWFVRPGISHVDTIFSFPEGAPVPEQSPGDNLTVLLTVANPLVWLALIPALLVVVRRAWRERSEELTVLLALLLFSYLPLVLAGRPIWFNTGVVVLPYVVILIACALGQLWPDAARGAGRRFVGLYLGGACLVSLALYPLAIGKGFELPVLGKYLLEKARNQQGESKQQYERQGN